jgi:hypothetical protein
MGISQYVTAKACRFNPFLYAAFASWIGAVACVFSIILFTEGVVVQMAILAVCMIVGYVIPGSKLNKLAKKNV